MNFNDLYSLLGVVGNIRMFFKTFFKGKFRFLSHIFLFTFLVIAVIEMLEKQKHIIFTYLHIQFFI